jgi:hypothetical protein
VGFRHLMMHYGSVPFDMNTVRWGYPTTSNGFCLTPNVARGRSRGTVRLRSRDFRDRAKVDPCYFTDPAGHDIAVMLAGVKLARRIGNQPPLRGWIKRELARTQPHTATAGTSHTYATVLVNAGVSLQALMALLGHMSAEMSLRYGRLFDTTVRAEYEHALDLAKQQARTPTTGRASLPLTDITGGTDWKNTPLLKSRMTSTLNRVERACAQLHHDGHPVTFAALAARAGLGRTTLYRDPTLRAVIEEHRHRATTSGTLTALTDEITTLRTHPRRPRHPSTPPRRTTSTPHSPKKLKALLTSQHQKTKIISWIMLRQRGLRVVLRDLQERTHPRLLDTHRIRARI